MVINFRGGSKRKFFDKDFMLKNFGEEHREAFGEDPTKGGYPDCGSGRYSEKLTIE